MSRPSMAGPTSARTLVFGVADFCLAISVVLLMSLSVAAGRADKQKPTTVASRGFLLKFYSTSANGIADYGGDQNDNL
jgi:hypothetical protein